MRPEKRWELKLLVPGVIVFNRVRPHWILPADRQHIVSAGYFNLRSDMPSSPLTPAIFLLSNGQLRGNLVDRASFTVV